MSPCPQGNMKTTRRAFNLRVGRRFGAFPKVWRGTSRDALLRSRSIRAGFGCAENLWVPNISCALDCPQSWGRLGFHRRGGKELRRKTLFLGETSEPGKARSGATSSGPETGTDTAFCSSFRRRPEIDPDSIFWINLARRRRRALGRSDDIHSGWLRNAIKIELAEENL
jgi:hypothetical protein